MARFDKLEFSLNENATDQAVTTMETTDASRWMRDADRARRVGNYESALRMYSRALELDRSVVDGWVGQVQMLVLLDECPEAELWSRKAIELFPGNGELFAGRAQSLCRRKDIKQAQELSDGALAREGESAYRWMVRGEIMLATKQKTVDHCFQKAKVIDSDWLVPTEIALICRQYGSPAKGITHLKDALQKSGEEVYVWYLLGLCQADLDMNAAARRSFEQCLEADPHHEPARHQLADLDNRGFSLFRWMRGFR